MIRIQPVIARSTAGATKQSAFLLLLLFSFLSLAYADSSATKILDEIPVQHNGRIKPFQSFAREAALNITGSVKYEGLSETGLVWNWIAVPENWNSKPMIPVPKILHQDFSLMIVKGRLSPEVILNHRPFLEKVQEAAAKRQKKEILTPVEKKRLEIYDRANLFQNIATGAVPGWIAHPEDPRVGWLPLQGLSAEQAQQTLVQLYPAERVAEVSSALGALINALRGRSAEAEAALQFRESLHRLLDSRGVSLDPQPLYLELIYNRLHPFGWAWKFYLLAAVLLSFARKRIAILAFTAGFLIHLYGFVLRCLIAGRPPVTNMYESLIWVSWAAVLFSIILFAVYRAALIPFTSSLVAAFALVIAESFPAVLDPTISPLVPVLRSNLWLTIHVLTITMSYGAFALAWGLGHAVVIKMTLNVQKGTGPFSGLGRKRDLSPSEALLSSYLYRALQIGVILLASGTVLGGVWANYSWGRFWGWDPKETWALIALLGYLVVLHGRFTGWLDSFAAAAGSVIAFLGVVMAWYGVNFVLSAGLHSYGFGGGGAPYVIAIALADLALILGLSAAYRKKIKGKPAVIS